MYIISVERITITKETKMDECLVTIKVKNNRIVKSIARSGYSTQAQFCREIGLSQMILSAFVNFKLSPVSTTGGWTPSATKLAEGLGCCIDHLFPEFTKEATQINEFDFEINRSELIKLNTSTEMKIDNDKLNNTLDNYIDRLHSREAKILRMYYGIGGREHNLLEISKDIGVTRERVRQIKDASIRKLRRGSTCSGDGGYAHETNRSTMSVRRELIGIMEDMEEYETEAVL